MRLFLRGLAWVVLLLVAATILQSQDAGPPTRRGEPARSPTPAPPELEPADLNRQDRVSRTHRHREEVAFSGRPLLALLPIDLGLVRADVEGLSGRVPRLVTNGPDELRRMAQAVGDDPSRYAIDPQAPVVSPRRPSGAEAIAERYVLAATNWNAGTYLSAFKQRVILSVPALRRELVRRWPTRETLSQLRRDREVRLSSIKRVERPGPEAVFLIDVGELHVSIGHRTQQNLTYRVVVRETREGPLVERFTAQRSRP